jgi:head-tail adaptor
MSQFYTDIVTVLKKSSTRGTGGQIVYTYTTTYDVYGSFQNLSGQWNIQTGILSHYKTPMFYCNWTTQIEEEDRLSYNGKMWTVVNTGRAQAFNFDDLECTLKGST